MAGHQGCKALRLEIGFCDWTEAGVRLPFEACMAPSLLLFDHHHMHVLSDQDPQTPAGVMVVSYICSAALLWNPETEGLCNDLEVDTLHSGQEIAALLMVSTRIEAGCTRHNGGRVWAVMIHVRDNQHHCTALRSCSLHLARLVVEACLRRDIKAGYILRKQHMRRSSQLLREQRRWCAPARFVLRC